MEEFITSKMALLTYGFKFGELMKLADKGLIRRRRRPCDGEDLYTFAKADIIKIAEEIANEKQAD